MKHGQEWNGTSDRRQGWKGGKMENRMRGKDVRKEEVEMEWNESKMN